MDDAVSSTVIDVLITFSKTRLSEAKSLELKSGDEVQELYNKIRNGLIIADELDDVSDPSVIWSAVLCIFESVPIFTVSTTNLPPEDIVKDLADSFKRACGSLLCSTELLLEYYPHNSAVVIASLQKAFTSPVVRGHSNATSFLLNLVEDYKVYFPYMYTFSRRIGKSPNVTLQDWKDVFFPSSNGKKGKDNDNADGLQDFSVDMSSWDLSGLEEGEDSDDDSSHVQPQSLTRIPTIRSKKTPTRMRSKANSSSVSSPNPTKRKTPLVSKNNNVKSNDSGNSSSLQLLDPSADTSMDSFIEVQELLSVHHEDDDDNEVFGKGSGSTAPSPAPDGSLSRRSKSEASFDLSNAGDEDMEEVITLDDLKAVFEQSLNDGEFLADKGKLSRNIKYNSDVPSLAVAVQKFHDTELSWDELKELAAHYTKEDKQFSSQDDSDDIPSRARQDTVVLAPPSGWDGDRHKTRKSMESVVSQTSLDESFDKKEFKSEWSNTRTHHKFPVDSIEIERSLKEESFDNNQSSPYLSLPKQPPSMTVVKEGEYFFREIDRDGDGLVSKIDLIKALRSNSPLAERLQLSKHIRQEDGSRDRFMGIFHSMDKDGSADISIDEFTDFLKDPSRQAAGGSKDRLLGADDDDDDGGDKGHKRDKGGDKKNGGGTGAVRRDDWVSVMAPQQSSDSPPVLPRSLSTDSEDILEASRGGGVSRAGGSQQSTALDDLESPDLAEGRLARGSKQQPAQSSFHNSNGGGGSSNSGSGSTSGSGNGKEESDIPDSFEKGKLALLPNTSHKTAAPSPQRQPQPKSQRQPQPKSQPQPEAGEGEQHTEKPHLSALARARQYLQQKQKQKQGQSQPSKQSEQAHSPQRTISTSTALPSSDTQPPQQEVLRSKSERLPSRRPPLPSRNAHSHTPFLQRSLRLREFLGLTQAQGEHPPPPPTELGQAMGVVLEGWLEKKSTITGLFQKRFVVLACEEVSRMGRWDNSTMNATNSLSNQAEGSFELRIFGHAVESAWGYVPIELKRVISMNSVQAVEAHANKKKIDAIFTITERLRADNVENRGTLNTDSPSPQAENGASSPSDSENVDVKRLDSFNSVNSDSYWTGKSRVVTLRAASPEARLLWISTLRKTMESSQ